MLHLNIIKVKTPEEMGKAAADEFEAVIHAKPACVMGLATGSTPLPLYRELIAREQAGKLDFSRVRSANLDHVEPQGLIYEFTAALTVICFQPAIHAADHAGAQPDRSAFLVIIHSSSFLSVTSVKIAAKPCKHGTLPDDRLRLFCKTAKPTAVCVSLKSPALRGFVGGPHA